MFDIKNTKIANKQDIIDYLTLVMLGKSSSSVLVNIRTKSSTYTEEIFKSPIQKERLKASELLSKYYDTSIISIEPTVILDDISSSFINFERVDFVENIENNQVPNITDVDEILIYLSSVMFGTSTSSVLVNIKDDTGSYSQEFEKFPSEDERLKSAEMLGKYYNMFSSNSPSSLPIILSKED